MSRQEQVFPEFFRAIWKKKEGYDPLWAKKKSEKWKKIASIVLLCVFVLLLLLVAVVLSLDKPTDGIMLGALLATTAFIIATMGFIAYSEGQSDRYRRMFNDFWYRLGALSSCLRVEENHLKNLADPPSLATATTARLKTMANFIVAIEKIPGEEKCPTLQELRRDLQRHLEEFQYWEAIPSDIGPGDFFPK